MTTNYQLFARVEANGNDILEGARCFVAYWQVTPQLIERLETIVNQAPISLGEVNIIDIELSDANTRPTLLWLFRSDPLEALLHSLVTLDEEEAHRFYLLPEGQLADEVKRSRGSGGSKWTFFQPTMLVHPNGGELRWRFEVANGPGYLETALLYVNNLVRWAADVERAVHAGDYK